MSDTPAMLYDYQSEGGALLLDAPTYVKRQADDELYAGLKAGQFCYVLNARQMGKSSLKVRTLQRLREEGIACAAVDLQGIGTTATEEQWYFGIISRIARSLGLHRQINLNNWWTEQPRLSYVQRFVEFLETLLLPAIAEPIVIFIDEVDLTLNLAFRDDFFGALRESYNRRADEPEYRRLTFALFGVASPSDLMQNKQATPFNIGRPVDLSGFHQSEAQPLLPGLAAKSNQSPALLQTVLEWTGGQPFLTQKLCKLVQVADSTPPQGHESQWVEQLVQTKVIDNWEAQDIPPHLKTIRDRLLLSGEQRSGLLLGLYQQIVQQGEIPANDSPEQLELRLTGLVVKRDERLRVYNRIYQQVFNRNWVETELAKLRPVYYGAAIAAWLKAGDESHLLRGEALRDAIAWSEGKQLSDEDSRFLRSSQEVESREVELRLAAEAEANQILTAARQQAEVELATANQQLEETERRVKRNRKTLMLTSVLAVGAAALAFGAVALAGNRFGMAREATANADRSKQEAIAANQEADAVKRDADRIKTERQQAIARAERNLSAAQQRETAAKQREQQAQQQFAQAQQEVQQAEVQLGQLNQAKTQAEQDKAAATAQLQTAQAEADRAEAAVRQAETTLTEAQTVTQLERLSSLALRQFEKDQTRALLTAMQAGQQLQEMVTQKAQARDAVLVNGKLSLAEYPAFSPIYSLNQTLSNIQYRSIPTRQGSVLSVSWTADGETLATGGGYGSVKLWNRQGELLKSLDAQQGDVRSVSWTADGETLATGGGDGSVKLWNRQGELLNSLDAQQGSVTSVSWTADGEILATGGGDGSVKLWAVDNLDGLLTRGCNWLRSYLVGTPTELQKLTACQTPDLLRAAAPNLVADSDALAKQGKLEAAILGYQTALRWDASLRFDPTHRARQLDQESRAEVERTRAEAERRDAINAAIALARQGEIDQALNKIQQLQQQYPDFELDANSWNSICWVGATYNQAAKVLSACEQAVNLAPDDWQIRDSRGLARALTGNISGAIEDFQFFVDGIDNAELKPQRQSWIDALRSGKPPSTIFTQELLEQLRNQ